MKRRFAMPGRPADVQPDMNVTPLVDVVLVLLIIFMVVAPRMEQDVPVELPGVFNPDPDSKIAVDPVKVTMARPGEFHLGDKQYDLDGVIGELLLLHQHDPQKRLVLRADARLKYGDVRPFLARAQEVGFPGMSFLVGEKHQNRHDASSMPHAPGVEPWR